MIKVRKVRARLTKVRVRNREHMRADIESGLPMVLMVEAVR